MADELRVSQLLEIALEPGGSPERACVDCPDLLPEVRRRWEECRRLAADLEVLFPAATMPASRNNRRSLRDVRGAIPQIEGYRFESLLGQGGMGVVYKVVDVRLCRSVALKTLLAGAYATQSELARFLREAQAIASMRHPHIVNVYDAGEHEGSPYFTMELVEGGTLAARLAGMPLPAEKGAELLAPVARAVEAAHRAGVVHRDLKPANILLTTEGVPKVSDFGLAVRPDAREEEGLTLTGQRLGTPSYMAPEQSSPRWGPVGPAADVYALGAILYETLTGRPPFRGDSPAETERQLLSEEPVPPSRLNTSVPRDIETVCLKCLEKDPSRRYASAADLADDLDRFSRDEPVRAVPMSRVGHTARWVKRHRPLAASLAGVAVLLVLLTVTSLAASAHFRRMEQQQRTLAEENGRIAREKEVQRLKAVRAEREEAELRRRAEIEGETLRQNLYFNQMNLGAQAAMHPSGIGRVGEWLRPWATSKPDLRNWEWYYLSGLCHREAVTLGTIDGVAHVAWSLDGRHFAAAGTNGDVVLWDAAEARELRRFTGHAGEVDTVAWSPDGTRLASAGRDGDVRVWHVSTGKAAFTYAGHRGRVSAVAWNADGKRIASCSTDGTVHVWDAGTGALHHAFARQVKDASDVAWSPDGRWLAMTSTDTEILIRDASSGAEQLKLNGHRNLVNRLAWNPSGTRLASASNDRTAKIWNVATGAEVATLGGHTSGVTSIAWSPNGARLATGGDDYLVKIWSAADGRESATLRGHTQRVTSVAWSPDGSRLASTGFDATIKLWAAATGPEVLVLTGHSDPAVAIAWSPDGRRLASASLDRTARIWDATGVREPVTLSGPTHQLRALAWSPDGQRLATAGLDGAIRIYEPASGKLLRSLRLENQSVFALAWAPDSRRLASGSGGVVHIWDAVSGDALRHLHGHRERVLSVDWNGDGTRLASASFDRTIRVWDVSAGREMLNIAGHELAVNGVAWSPDGQRLASAGSDQTVKVWDAAGGRFLFSLRGHTTQVNSVRWSPDGTRLASSSNDHTIKLWHAATGREALTLDCGGNMVHAVAWAPDGLRLATASEDHKVRIFDATPGYVRARSPRCLPVLDRRRPYGAPTGADWQLRAEIHARQGEWDAAIECVRQRMRLDPQLRWCVLGGWVAGPHAADLSDRSPPPLALYPEDPVATAHDRRVDWLPVMLDGNGHVNFGEMFDGASDISACAQLRIYSAGRQEVTVLLGSDDGARLWLNGQAIHEASGQRRAVPETDAIPAALEPGWNTLTARVANATGMHALYLRLTPRHPFTTGPARGEPR
ncbi:MAG TPA: serine/threonine-protein kinase [Tepidisphaeraceae bacterium]|jgi:WD40 repeat protein